MKTYEENDGSFDRCNCNKIDVINCQNLKISAGSLDSSLNIYWGSWMRFSRTGEEDISTSDGHVWITNYCGKPFTKEILPKMKNQNKTILLFAYYRSWKLHPFIIDWIGQVRFRTSTVPRGQNDPL